MTLERAQNPFQFMTQVNLVELTGMKALDLHELVSILRTAPGSVIYHHTHHFLKQHQFLSPEPPNDFAYWVTNILLEERLGEQLAAIDTVRYHSIQALGNKIIEVLDRYLAQNKTTRTAPEGEEFHIMKSQSFILPLPHRASDLAEFFEAIKQVSIHSLYYHIFDSRMRLGQGSNDFSHWLENELKEKALAQSISRMDPYTQTLEGLRQRVVQLVQLSLSAHEKEGSLAPR